MLPEFYVGNICIVDGHLHQIINNEIHCGLVAATVFQYTVILTDLVHSACFQYGYGDDYSKTKDNHYHAVMCAKFEFRHLWGYMPSFLLHH